MHIQQEERDIAALEAFCKQLRVPGSGEWFDIILS